jgi:hypothetical protein
MNELAIPMFVRWQGRLEKVILKELKVFIF